MCRDHQRYGVSWPEGQPEKWVQWESHSGRRWAEFWLGVRSGWPNPTRARRISSAYWYRTKEATPAETAMLCDRMMNDGR